MVKAVFILDIFNCFKPVFLTKNGRGRFVIIDIEDYERQQAERKLLAKLREAENAVESGSDWLTVDELKQAMEE